MDFIYELILSASEGFLLVFDLTSIPSLRKLEILYDHIRQKKNYQDFPLVLIGNKSDLECQPMVIQDILSKKWPGRPYYETSAISGGSESVGEAFKDISRQIVSKHQQWKGMFE
ncbi:hypothetical protein GQ43DRAFT_278001 [Delitschia confertaspora ATCC 74209]|uniref:Ras family protein n=1 Tax=Delitschia confertaspora ATCC 74209 TaxID=1513339 RepID=A0A9P4JB95_9PLEO|nr:hypothetical protein GQ43DRAFT_278001 [Delitschia confertaspora ATCC 74209]